MLIKIVIEIRDDVQEECEKYGKILTIKIPRPSGGSRQSAGVGKIYVKYETPESAAKALRALAGRKFADRTVVTTFFPEVSFGRVTLHSVGLSSAANKHNRRTLTSMLGKERVCV